MFVVSSGNENSARPSSEMAMILKELRMMRKDINFGMNKLQKEMQAVNHTLQCQYELYQNLAANRKTQPFCLNNQNIVTSSNQNKVINPPSFNKNMNSGENSINSTEESNSCNTADIENKRALSIRIVNCRNGYDHEDSNVIRKVCEKVVKSEPHDDSHPTAFAESVESDNDDDDDEDDDSDNLHCAQSQSRSFNNNVVSTTLIDTKDNTKLKIKFNCNVCSKNFNTLNRLKKHRFEVHRYFHKYVCNLCGRSCSSATYLRIHSRIHTGEKPYKCTICGTCFSDKSNYSRHCRNRKTRSCVDCKKNFCSLSLLKTHYRSHE